MCRNCKYFGYTWCGKYHAKAYGNENCETVKERAKNTWVKFNKDVKGIDKYFLELESDE